MVDRKGEFELAARNEDLLIPIIDSDKTTLRFPNKLNLKTFKTIAFF